MAKFELPADLPPGRFATPRPRNTDPEPVEKFLWVSDDPVPDVAGKWARLYAEHPRTGLYPLLLESLPGYPDRPWHDGDLSPHPVSAIEGADTEAFLRSSFEHYGYNEPWLGLAPASAAGRDPGAAAARTVAELCEAPATRWFLGLVPALRGADALSVCGWDGPANYTNDIWRISAVVRTWEDRFGARVVGAGFNTLHLSFAASPVAGKQVRAFAAELIGFCPPSFYGYFINDLVDGVETPEGIKGSIVGETYFGFWWD